MKRGLFMLLILVLLFSQPINAQVTGEVTTGKVSAMPTNVSIFVLPSAPELIIISPQNKTYLANTSILLNYTATNANTTWYNIDNSANITIASYVYFQTSSGSHTLYLFANNSIGTTAKNVTFLVNSSIFTIQYTKWEGAYNGSSTYFEHYPYEDMQNLSNIILENTLYGKMLFNEVINLTNDASPNNNILDLDSYINLSFNRIELNASALPNFNKTATLWLNNLTFANPRILKDGSACPSAACAKESYTGGTLKFNVTGFSIYSAEETPAEQPSPGGSSGGGGGGGEGTSKIIKGINLDKEKITIKLKQGETKIEEISITNKGNQQISIKLYSPKLEDFMKISEKEFNLSAGETKIITLDIIAREDTPSNLYIGKLIIEAYGLEKEMLIAIEVGSAKPLLDVKVEIPKRFLAVSPEEEILATISLFNVIGSGKVDVRVEYIIKNEENQVIVFDEETVAVETQTSFIKEFKIPPDAKYGAYMIYIKTTYNENVASASAWFEVSRKSFLTTENIWLIIFIFIIIFILIVFYELRKIRRYIKDSIKIDEKTLVREGLVKPKGIKEPRVEVYY